MDRDKRWERVKQVGGHLATVLARPPAQQHSGLVTVVVPVNELFVAGFRRDR